MTANAQPKEFCNRNRDGGSDPSDAPVSRLQLGAFEPKHGVLRWPHILFSPLPSDRTGLGRSGQRAAWGSVVLARVGRICVGSSVFRGCRGRPRKPSFCSCKCNFYDLLIGLCHVWCTDRGRGVGESLIRLNVRLLTWCLRRATQVVVIWRRQVWCCWMFPMSQAH